MVSWCRMLALILADDSRFDAFPLGAFVPSVRGGAVSVMAGQTNHLTRHVGIDLMPQSRHKKERFSPKGDECEPQRIEKNPRQIGRFPCQECSQEEAGPHPAPDRFQVLWLV